MSEAPSTNVQQGSMLFQKALERANGPIDADHIAYVVMLATADDLLDAKQEQAEQDFLVLLLVSEIRQKKAPVRSFENIFDLLTKDDLSAVEPILKISEFWKTDDQARQLALRGVRGRLVQVLQADDPAFAVE